MFYQEVPTGLNAVFSTPHSDKVLIIAGGTAHLLDTVNYSVQGDLDDFFTYNFIRIVETCVAEEVILIASYIDIACIDKNGILWESRFEYEISALKVMNGTLTVNGVSAGVEEPWQMKANLKDGSIISSTGL